MILFAEIKHANIVPVPFIYLLYLHDGDFVRFFSLHPPHTLQQFIEHVLKILVTIRTCYYNSKAFVCLIRFPSFLYSVTRHTGTHEIEMYFLSVLKEGEQCKFCSSSSRTSASTQLYHLTGVSSKHLEMLINISLHCPACIDQVLFIHLHISNGIRASSGKNIGLFFI